MLAPLRRPLRDLVTSVATAPIALPRFARRFWVRQSPHSLFISGAGLLFCVTLAIDLLLHREGLSPVLVGVLLFLCAALSASALVTGRRFPEWIGFACVVTFISATVFFFSPWGDEQSAVSSAQELPILALYLGWFVRRPLGRLIMLVATALIVLAVAVNPLFWPDGTLGVPTGVQMIVIALFCFEVGSMLWRHSERRITTDQLTGALNRAGFLKRLDEELARTLRSGTPLSLVVVDFDHFKQLNDTQGHAAGDRALIESVDVWRDGVRAGDVIGRTGGDEFALLLDRTDAHGAQQTMRRLRDASPHAWSWGIAQARPGDTSETIFARADQILYSFKRRRT